MPAGREDFWNIGYPLPAILVYLAAPIIVCLLYTSDAADE